MIDITEPAAQEIFGLFELSKDGTVLYSRSRPNGESAIRETEPVGQDFFFDIARIENRTDLRRHFRNFVTSARSADNFVFDCVVDGKIVKTKINMTRAREHNSDHTDGIVILDIKKATF